jgi:hypothetical protein
MKFAVVPAFGIRPSHYSQYIATSFVKYDVARDVCPRFLLALCADDGIDDSTVGLLHKESFQLIFLMRSSGCAYDQLTNTTS